MSWHSRTSPLITAELVGQPGGLAKVKTGQAAQTSRARGLSRWSSKRYGIATGWVLLTVATVTSCSGNVADMPGAMTTNSDVPARHGFAAAPATATSPPPTAELTDSATTTAVVPAAAADSLLIPPAQASAAVGVPMALQGMMQRPMPAASLAEHAECAALVYPNDQTFGHDYTAFRLSHLRNNTSDLVQIVATYPDATTAQRTFHATFNESIDSCDEVSAQDQQKTFESEFKVEAVTQDGAIWSTTPLVGRAAVGFFCTYDAGIEANVMFAVRLCKPDAGGSAVSGAIAEGISAKISGIVGQ
jgi:PknH-like extracellular domain